ncbi:hypothetical protein DYB37_013186, partial [Aphanomyces astaci]
ALTPSGASDDVGGGAGARGAVDAKRVFGATCERLVERVGFADGEFLDVGARRCAGASNGSAIVGGAADESIRGVQSAVGTSTEWSIDSGGAASSRRLSGGGAGDCGAATSGGADVEDGDGGESEEEEKSEAAEEEEPPRDPKDRLPSLHRS